MYETANITDNDISNAHNAHDKLGNVTDTGNNDDRINQYHLNVNESSIEEMTHESQTESQLPECAIPSPDIMKEISPDESVARKFRLMEVQKFLQFLHFKGYPLPQQFSLEEWQILMKLKSSEYRIKYIDSLFFREGKEPPGLQNYTPEQRAYLEKILRKDEDCSQWPKQKVFDTPERLVDLDAHFLSKSLFDSTYFDCSYIDKTNADHMRAVAIAEHIYDDMIVNGMKVPQHLSKKEFEHDLIPISDSTRKVSKFLTFLADKHWKKCWDIVLTRSKFIKYLDRKLEGHEIMTNREGIHYGVGMNTILRRVYDKDMDFAIQWFALRHSILPIEDANPPLVLDMAFFDTMSMKSRKSVSRHEVPYSFKSNRWLRASSPTYFCGTSQKTVKFLESNGNVNIKNTMNFYGAEIREECFSQIFPKENLVYLSPNSKNPLTYNPNDIYIIGALNDKDLGIPSQTLHKARSLGIRHARFPMPEVIGLGRELNIEASVAIIEDLRASQGDWFYAFRWLCPRFLRNAISSGSCTKRFEAIYKAHGALSPSSNLDLMGMRHPEYRRLYTQMLKESDFNNISPNYDIFMKYRGNTNRILKQKRSKLHNATPFPTATDNSYSEYTPPREGERDQHYVTVDL